MWCLLLTSVRASTRKRWRLALAVQALQQRRYLRPDDLAVLVGHFTHLQLARRLLLSVWSAVYAFVHRSSRQRQRLPDDALEELQLAAALLPLACADLTADLAAAVYVSDASEEYFSVMRGHPVDEKDTLGAF